VTVSLTCKENAESLGRLDRSVAMVTDAIKEAAYEVVVR
jgi:hypothetical protein